MNVQCKISVIEWTFTITMSITRYCKWQNAWKWIVDKLMILFFFYIKMITNSLGHIGRSITYYIIGFFFVFFFWSEQLTVSCLNWKIQKKVALPLTSHVSQCKVQKIITCPIPSSAGFCMQAAWRLSCYEHHVRRLAYTLY